MKPTSFLYLLLAFFTLAPAAQAQRPAGASGAAPGSRTAMMPQGQISGTILDADTGTPIEMATVALWRMADSTLATGAVTKADGSFLIEGMRPGRYYAQVSFIGYHTHTVDAVNLTPGALQFAMGTVCLAPDTALLDEVEVTAERDFMEVRIDKNVYNTRDQIVSIGGSATDVLRNIPSIEVDIDGQVSLRGSQNVAVLINGKPSQMNGEMLASFLAGLPASSIERVEVIPNPSARYEPDGMSGILNIVLKQDAERGISGAVTAGVGTLGDYNLSGMLGYSQGPLSARVTYGFRNGTRQMEGTRFNEYRFRQPFDYLEVLNDGERSRRSNTVNLNVDYKLSRQNMLSLSGMVGSRGNDGNELNAYSELGADHLVTSRYDRRSTQDGHGFNLDYGLSFSRTLDPGKHEFIAEVRFQNRDEDNANTYEQELLQPDAAPLLTDLERTTMGQQNRNTSVQLDYVRPIGADGKLETGYKGTLQQLDYDYYAEAFSDAQQAYLPDLNQNNTFQYDQQVHAAYAILEQQFGRLGAQVGLRAEQVQTTFDLATTNEAYDNDYFSLFPSTFLTYKVNDAHQFRLSYSKRINRPRTWFLNPFSNREDPLFRREGNPYLRPEYVHSMELTYKQTAEKTSLTISPYYRRTIDVIRFIDSVDEAGVTTLTFKNLDKSESFGAEVIGTLRMGDRFNTFASFDAYRVATDGSNVETSLSNNAFGWSTRLNATYKLTSLLDLQASLFYRAPMNVEQGRIAAMTRSDIALRQQFPGKKASLSLRVNDPFDTAGFRIQRDTPTFYLENTRRFDSRSVNLTFTYNFGRQDRNTRRRGGSRDDDGPGGDGMDVIMQ